MAARLGQKKKKLRPRHWFLAGDEPCASLDGEETRQRGYWAIFLADAARMRKTLVCWFSHGRGRNRAGGRTVSSKVRAQSTTEGPARVPHDGRPPVDDDLSTVA